MQNRALTLPIAASVAAGAKVDVSTMGAKCVYVTGTFSATVQIQISADGTNWVDEGAALTAAGTLEITKLAIYVRANTTAYASGTPAGLLIGETSTEGGMPVTTAL